MEEYEKLLSPKTRMVSVNHVSNALGTVNPIKEITRLAHEAGAKVLIDGAQSTPHLKIDVQDIDCDFYTFSGHKMYAPSGVGGLFGKYDVLKEMPPYVTGGDMIRQVTIEKTLYADPPARFEAGTPAISQVMGLGEAVDYLQEIGFDKIAEYEQVTKPRAVCQPNLFGRYILVLFQGTDHGVPGQACTFDPRRKFPDAFKQSQLAEVVLLLVRVHFSQNHFVKFFEDHFGLVDFLTLQKTGHQG